MDISVIIVNFRSRQFLKDCLFSLEEKLKNIAYETIIVNNDEEPLESSFSQSNVRILNMSSNLGFAKACNAGAKLADGKILFFLNPDTKIIQFNSKDVFEKVGLSDIGIVAPKVLLDNGNLQPWSAGNELGLWKLIGNKLGIAKDASFESKHDFDWVTGAAFMIRKELFLKKGGFDESFFMYFEDIDLCHRLRKAGFKIIRLDGFSILHIGGQSYSDKKIQKAHYYQSQDYYFQKHFGIFTVTLATLLRKIFLTLR